MGADSSRQARQCYPVHMAKIRKEKVAASRAGRRPRTNAATAATQGRLATAVGELAIGRVHGSLTAEWIVQEPTKPSPSRRNSRTHRSSGDAPYFSMEDGAAVELIASLQSFFDGDAGALDDIPVGDGTPFQRRVWRACRRIPLAETRTYLWLARKLGGGHELCRAIGQALRRNPLPVVVPCHRVVASSGLGGYAGATTGRLAEIKRALLEHEARLAGRLLH